MSLLLGNLRDLIGELWDGTELPPPDDGECAEPVEDDYVVAPRE